MIGFIMTFFIRLFPIVNTLASKGKGKKATAPAPSEDVSDFGKAVAALKSDSKGSKKTKRQPKVQILACLL